MEKGYFYEHWYEVLLELSKNYSNLRGVVAMLMGAWPLEYTGISASEIIKVEDDLIQKGIIPRRVEYNDDGMAGYIEEGEDVIKDIKRYLWLVLYDERREREHEERRGKK